MPFDGSGGYSPPSAPTFPAVSGAVISSTYYNSTINDISTALNNVLTRDGQGKPSAAINWNGQNLTNVNTFGVLGAATFAAAVTVGTTLGVTGAATLATSLTVGTTLGVTGIATFSGNAYISNIRPELRFIETDASANETIWEMFTSAGDFYLRSYNDALSSFETALTITRNTHEVTAITFAGDAIQLNGATTISGNTVWHAGNDGAGSGLDADLLDGSQGSAYALKAAANVFTATQLISNTAPELRLTETDASADNGIWKILASAEKLYLASAYNDALASPNHGIIVDRTGTTIDSIALAATTVGVTGTFAVTGNVTVSDNGNGISFTNGASGNFNIGLLAGGASQVAYVYQRANANLLFGTNNTTKMTLNTTGQLGIGQTSPSNILDVYVASGNSIVEVESAAAGVAGLLMKGSAGNAYLYCNVGSAAGLFISGDGANTHAKIDTSGNLGIGTTSPSAKLDVAFGNMTVLIGADSGASTRTNATNKIARIGAAHYTNAEEAAGVLIMTTSSSQNLLAIGGGSSLFNAATSIQFYTAASNVTTTGTLGMTLDGSQNLTVVGSVSDSIGNVRRLVKSATTSGTIGVANAGKLIRATAGVTIQDDVFAANDTVIIINKSGGAITITEDTNLTMTDTNGSTGNRTLADNGVATVWFNSTNDAHIFGTGLS